VSWVGREGGREGGGREGGRDEYHFGGWELVLGRSLPISASLPPSLPPAVIGRSKLVGLPLALLLLGRDATVTIAHSKTPKEDLQALCKEADVVVGAVGMPRFIQPDWIKKG